MTKESLCERVADMVDNSNWSPSWHWERNPHQAGLSLAGVRRMAEDCRNALDRAESRVSELRAIMPEALAYLAEREAEEESESTQ